MARGPIPFFLSISEETSVMMSPTGSGSTKVIAARFPISLLGCVVVFKSYYYFSSSVPLFQIADRLSDLTQRVTPVDNRCYCSRRHQIAHDGQVLFIHSRHKRDELLAHEA